MNHEYLYLLGMRVRDRVTNVTGVVVSLSFDLYGCLQAVVEQTIDKDGKVPVSHWFDCKRLKAIEAVQLLEVPKFDASPNYTELLGSPVQDLVTKFAGVVTSICFDLTGSVQASVKPGILAGNKLRNPVWFDCRRIKVTGSAVMPVPTFENMAQGAEAGPAEKTMRASTPPQ